MPVRCADDGGWWTGSEKKTCVWVSKKAESRCKKVGHDEKTGYEACPETCETCPDDDSGGECEDDEDWHAAGNSRKTCAWVGKQASTRCKKADEAGVTGFVSCPVTCATCEVDADDGSDEDCEDDAEWFVENNAAKTCSWVAKDPTSRCTKKGQDGRRASESCSVSCETCADQGEDNEDKDLCEDKAGWFKKNSPDKTCTWVAKDPATRCNKQGQDGTKASESCKDSCASCEEEDAE